jgi:hypothetical protein
VNLKATPPWTLSAQTRPRCASIKPLEIDRPSPMPGELALSRQNLSNKRPSAPFGMWSPSLNARARIRSPAVDQLGLPPKGIEKAGLRFVAPATRPGRRRVSVRCVMHTSGTRMSSYWAEAALDVLLWGLPPDIPGGRPTSWCKKLAALLAVAHVPSGACSGRRHAPEAPSLIASRTGWRPRAWARCDEGCRLPGLGPILDRACAG